MSRQVGERPGQAAYREIQKQSRSSTALGRWSGEWVCIARGATSMVFVVNDRILFKKVAVKRLVQDEHGLPVPCLTEIQTLRMVDHPHVLDFYSVIHSGRFVYMSFEFCELGDLSNIMFSISNMNTVRRLCYELACGVSCLHRNGILHRDLKPENILITRYGSVRVGDCGIAALKCPPGTEKLFHETGTLPYRSPEQVVGTIDYSFSSDIWSLGVIFCQLARGGPNIFSCDCYNNFVQLMFIRRSLGNPTEELWPSLKKYQAQLARSSFWKLMNSLPPYSRLSFQRFFHADPRLTSILDTILQWEPTKRPSIDLILKSDYFADMDEYNARREETIREFESMFGQAREFSEFEAHLKVFMKMRKGLKRPVNRFFDEPDAPDVTGYSSRLPIFDLSTFLDDVRNLPAQKKLEYRNQFGPTWISDRAQMRQLELMVQLSALVVHLLQSLKKSVGKLRSHGVQFMLLEKKWLIRQIQGLAITETLKTRLRRLRPDVEIWKGFQRSLLDLGVRMRFWSAPPCDGVRSRTTPSRRALEDADV